MPGRLAAAHSPPQHPCQHGGRVTGLALAALPDSSVIILQLSSDPLTFSFGSVSVSDVSFILA